MKNRKAKQQERRRLSRRLEFLEHRLTFDAAMAIDLESMSGNDEIGYADPNVCEVSVFDVSTGAVYGDSFRKFLLQPEATSDDSNTETDEVTIDENDPSPVVCTFGPASEEEFDITKVVDEGEPIEVQRVDLPEGLTGEPVGDPSIEGEEVPQLAVCYFGGVIDNMTDAPSDEPGDTELASASSTTGVDLDDSMIDWTCIDQISGIETNETIDDSRVSIDPTEAIPADPFAIELIPELIVAPTLIDPTMIIGKTWHSGILEQIEVPGWEQAFEVTEDWACIDRSDDVTIDQEIDAPLVNSPDFTSDEEFDYRLSYTSYTSYTTAIDVGYLYGFTPADDVSFDFAGAMIVDPIELAGPIAVPNDAVVVMDETPVITIDDDASVLAAPAIAHADGSDSAANDSLALVATLSNGASNSASADDSDDSIDVIIGDSSESFSTPAINAVADELLAV